MKLLALDIGDARIGLAAGQSGSSLVFGRGHIVRRSLKVDLRALISLAEKEEAGLFVVGLPLRTDGKDSAQTAKVRAFADALAAEGVEVCFEDERFTTMLATRKILSGGADKKRRRDKGLLDEASAVLILESYLATHPYNKQLE